MERDLEIGHHGFHVQSTLLFVESEQRVRLTQVCFSLFEAIYEFSLVEDDQGWIMDDTALNKIGLYCCEVY